VNRELPRAAENRIQAALDQAAWLEAAVLVLPSSALSPAVEALGGAAIDDSYHLAGESLLRLRFEAQRRAVAIACCVPGDRMLGAPLETRDFLDRINSPWVGADLDLSPSTKRNPCDWVAVLTHRIRSVTIDELIAKSHGAAVAASLRSAAYDGYAVLRGVAPSPGLHKLAASWFMAP
jgi:hexulose-6-phosphate isomerase